MAKVKNPTPKQPSQTPARDTTKGGRKEAPSKPTTPGEPNTPSPPPAPKTF